MPAETLAQGGDIPSGKVDMSMQLSATPAANTLAAADASEAPAAGD